MIICGGPVVWKSKLQSTALTSSMQVEYQAMYAKMQELVWLRGVLGDIARPEDELTPFLIESQSAEELALNQVFHKRSKHIEIKYHCIRKHVGPGVAQQDWCMWSQWISPRCCVVQCSRHKPMWWLGLRGASRSV